jgi:hypothetical protein
MTKKAKAGRLFPAVVIVLILLAATAVNALTPLVHADGSPVSGGDIIVADDSAKAVFRQSPSGGAPTTIFSGAPYAFPWGVAIDASGNLIVADDGADAVFGQSPSGGAPTTIFSGPPYAAPVDVAIYEYAPVVPPGGGPGLGAGMLIVLIMLIVILSGVGAAAVLSRRLSVGAQRPIR